MERLKNKIIELKNELKELKKSDRIQDLLLIENKTTELKELKNELNELKNKIKTERLEKIEKNDFSQFQIEIKKLCYKILDVNYSNNPTKYIEKYRKNRDEFNEILQIAFLTWYEFKSYNDIIKSINGYLYTKKVESQKTIQDNYNDIIEKNIDLLDKKSYQIFLNSNKIVKNKKKIDISNLKLTNKQKEFLFVYIHNFNLTKSAEILGMTKQNCQQHLRLIQKKALAFA